MSQASPSRLGMCRLTSHLRKGSLESRRRLLESTLGGGLDHCKLREKFLESFVSTIFDLYPRFDIRTEVDLRYWTGGHGVNVRFLAWSWRVFWEIDVCRVKERLGDGFAEHYIEDHVLTERSFHGTASIDVSTM